MTVLRHILIIGVLFPWLGGTLFCFFSYMNEKVTDYSSYLYFLFMAGFAAIIGLILTIIINVFITALTFLVFRTLKRKKERLDLIACVTVTLTASALYGISLTGIADEIRVTKLQLFLSAIIPALIVGYLSFLNWNFAKQDPPSIPPNPHAPSAQVTAEVIKP